MAATPAVTSPPLVNGIYYIRAYQRTNCSAFLSASACGKGAYTQLSLVRAASSCRGGLC